MDFLQKIHLNYNVKNERVHVRQLSEGKRTFQGKATESTKPLGGNKFLHRAATRRLHGSNVIS